MWRRIFSFILLLAFAYLLPVQLFWLGLIPFEFRFRVLIFMALALIAYAAARRHTLADLGFRKDTLGGSLRWNGILCLVLILVIFILDQANLIREPTIPEWSYFFAFYVFISSPAQEFLFRSMIFAEMKKVGIHGSGAQVALSTLNYCFLHVIYRDLLTLVATFLLGVAWGLIYRRYPNFWGVTLAHAVLGTVSICVGLI